MTGCNKHAIEEHVLAAWTATCYNQ